MSLTAIVFIAFAILVLRSIVRRPQAITVTLALAFAFAIWLSFNLVGPSLRPLLTGIDALVVAIMAGLWTKYHSNRARIVGALGMVKVGMALFSGGTGLSWPVWAATNNALFVMQVLVAGGDADGIGSWLADRWRRLRAGSRGVLGNVGR